MKKKEKEEEEKEEGNLTLFPLFQVPWSAKNKRIKFAEQIETLKTVELIQLLVEYLYKRIHILIIYICLYIFTLSDGGGIL